MPSEDEGHAPRIPRKISRPRRGKSDGITQSLNLPARSASRSSRDDDEPDVSLPCKGVPFNMNQSLLQLFTKGRTNISMGARFDGEYDDDDDDEEDESAIDTDHGTQDKGKGVARRTGGGDHPPRPFNRLHSIEETGDVEERGEDDPLSATQSSLGKAPYMSQILEAQAYLNPEKLGESVTNEQDKFLVDVKDQAEHNSDLAKKLMDIFGLREPEELVAEYPCWLLKSVLLQGYLYVTAKHICFFAYLPKKTDAPTKTGYLSKRGKSTLKYTRYWFILKGDVLSYYDDPSELYFVHGHIDLRYGTSADVTESRDGKGSTGFTLTAGERQYYFKADSVSFAKEWVKTLRRVIFRTHNEGDSVKISIPVANVIEVEESTVLEFTDTVKIKVYPNDDTYAVDEYYFSFFGFGNDAIQVLKSIADESAARNGEEISGHSTPSAHSQDFTTATNSFLHEGVKDTLSLPGSRQVSPRPSGEFPRSSVEASRSAFDGRVAWKRTSDAQRQSLDGRRQDRRTFSADSTDLSFADSYDNVSSDGEGTQSASNILSGSDVFHSPTMGHSQSLQGTPPRKKSSKLHKKDRGTPPSTVLHPPTRRHTADSSHDPAQDEAESSNHSVQTLQDISKSGAYPLQRAANWAGWIKKRSKKMGTLGNVIGSQPMGYFEKVSDLWTGGRKHTGVPSGSNIEELTVENEREGPPLEVQEQRFRTHFALRHTERLTATYFAHLHRVLPLYGKIYVGTHHLCFRSLVPGTKTKLILPLRDIENIDKEKGFRFGYSGLVVTIRGHEEIFFEFSQGEDRDDCAVTLLRNINDVRVSPQSGVLSETEKHEAEAAKIEHQILHAARARTLDFKPTEILSRSKVTDAPPIVFDDPCGSILNFKPEKSMTITCLTIGSRGDVQPYIALCLGLKKDGHTARIATHAEFKDWVESYDIEFRPVAGDPAELMALCVEYGMFTVDFLKEASGRMRGWLDGLLMSSWEAAQGSDLLIESPSAMGGIHIAEALGIPYFRAFTMPWTRTRAYPHAFAVPEHKMGGAYNYFTYVIIDNVFWKSTAGQINRWRKEHLGLPRTSLDKLQPNKVPFLYNFSQYVVAPPLDFSDWIHVTGYWFLDTNQDWKPPQDLVDFIQKARDDGKKLVYIGFGSVTVADPEGMTKVVVESVLRADVRCVLSKGWSDRLTKKDPSEPEVPMPPEIHLIKSCPHDWLFKQMDAACHHGGAGTTGASLRAGIPTIIKPFFGDQWFFGSRVEDLGVGVCVKKMTVTTFSKALRTATHDERMMVKSEVLGDQIRKENGVDVAIQTIYRDLDYARTLIKARDFSVNKPADDSEESWTFIGDDSDTDRLRSAAKAADKAAITVTSD